MSAAWIRKRKTVKGETRYQVLYRQGGREAAIRAAGTFKLDREARTRRDLIGGWLAAGLDPKAEFAKLAASTVERTRPFQVEAEALIATRHDASTESIRSKRNALAKIRELRPDLATKAAADWTVRDVQELVTGMVDQGLAPATIDRYLIDGPKLVLDFAVGRTNNPARDATVKPPRIVRHEVSPPTADHFLAIIERVPPRLVLSLVVLEQTGMRLGEVTTLPWGDVDVAGARFRLSRERTKTTRPRWVQVPSWLMAVIDGTVAAEDRVPERRVFPVSASTIRQAMGRACRTAGIPLYSPHDLRHRRASLWHGQGLSVAELKERGGWAKAEIALDVYSHVMPLDEAPREALERVLVMPR